MPFYYSIKRMPKKQRARTLAGLTRLRSQLDTEMPQKTRSKTLVLGTWNIRNFDDNRFKAGPRTKEDMFYIAEIISRFDVLAVQEICNDLYPLDKIMTLLGDDFDYIATDVTEGPAGNQERLGYIFGKSKVRFTGVAGELVLPDNMQIIDGEKRRQFSRSPFLCSFQSGWFKFLFSTVHIYFGETSGPKYDRRVNEIKAVAKFLKSRADKDAKSRKRAQNHILVGDFNIKKTGSPGFNALQEQGFKIFENNEGSNKDQTKFYDQISFLVNPEELNFTGSGKDKGVLPFFDSIYRPEDFDDYRDELLKTMDAKIKLLGTKIKQKQAKFGRATTAAKQANAQKEVDTATASLAKAKSIKGDDIKLKKYYTQDWRTFHGSDHFPLWVELEIDFSGDYLAGLA